jgi:hypothetical protein
LPAFSLAGLKKIPDFPYRMFNEAAAEEVNLPISGELNDTDHE